MRYLLLLSVLLLACEKNTTEPEPQPILITTGFSGYDTVGVSVFRVTPYFDLSSFSSFKFSWTTSLANTTQFYLALSSGQSDGSFSTLFEESPASSKTYTVSLQPHQIPNRSNIRFRLVLGVTSGSGNGYAYNFKVEGFK